MKGSVVKRFIISILGITSFGIWQVSCHQQEVKKALPDPQQTEDLRMIDSKFCGDTRPEKPLDPTPAFKFDRGLIQSQLANDGLVGWIHGAVSQYKTYTFTYRLQDENDPMAFFKAEQFSLVPSSAEVAAELRLLKRHDKVRLFGTILANGSPIPHLMISKIEIIERYPLATNNYYETDISKLIDKEKIEILAQIHATASSPELGTGLVLEWQDVLLPVAIPRELNDLATPLYRGDIIKISLKLVNSGHKTQHFILDSSVNSPLKVVDSILNCHNQMREVTGYLAKFDRSPAITTDVYAIRVVDKNGIGRNFTLFPASQESDKFIEVFRSISAKAKAAWTNDLLDSVVVRNFRKKESVIVKAQGKINVVSSEQANAQIYIENSEDVQFSN